MQISESIELAISSVRVNKLRSSLTLLSICIGVFAIIGSTTVVDSFNAMFSDQLAQLGANTYMIRKFPAIVTGEAQWKKYMKRKDITLDQAQMLRTMATMGQTIGIWASNSQLVKANGQATDGPIGITGCDENYFLNNNYTIAGGRQLTSEDVLYKRDLAIIGSDVASRLFANMNPIGQNVAVGQKFFTIIGVCAAKGSAFGQSQDNFVLIPVTTFMKYYANTWSSSVSVTVRARSAATMDDEADQIVGALRTLRKVAPWDDNDFEIISNDSVISAFEGFTKYIAYFAVGVSAISLLAAGIGIMNIMLVSVKERTREIGILKAIGATRGNILSQFLIESIVLCQLGGLGGMVLGIAAGNLLALYLSTSFVIPWVWIILSVLICTIIGIGFGVYPAWRAASLDPIEALRYE